MRASLRRRLIIVGFVLAVGLWPGVALAHPLGNFTVNTASAIQLSPGRVQLDYIVDMAEIPTEQERSTIDVSGDGRISDDELTAWARATAAELGGGVELAVDGAPVALRVECAIARLSPGQGGLPVLRLDAGYSGEIPASGRLGYRDANYEGRIGWHEVTASSVQGVALSESSVPVGSPSDHLRAYPDGLLQAPPDVRAATLSYGPGTSEATPTAPCSHRALAPRQPPGTEDGGFAGLVRRSELTPLVLGLSMLLAVGFGALHALAPGHGKTLMAAYLVGAGGRVRQAVAVGGAVAVMHTASVLALGLLVLSLERTFSADRVYPWLGLVSGLVALGLGATLLVRRLSWWGDVARMERDRASDGPEESSAPPPADPAHDDDRGHAHGHDHRPGRGGHTHPVPGDSLLSRRGLLALAVAGGILPSPTALVVLLSAVSFHRVLFGLSLIAGFSLGLAGALIVIGILAVRARDFVSIRLSTGVGRLLPVLSAAVITGVGLILTIRGAIQL
jgi:nickel/cobalt transporter (NicO) family protein